MYYIEIVYVFLRLSEKILFSYVNDKFVGNMMFDVLW